MFIQFVILSHPFNLLFSGSILLFLLIFLDHREIDTLYERVCTRLECIKLAYNRKHIRTYPYTHTHVYIEFHSALPFSSAIFVCTPNIDFFSLHFYSVILNDDKRQQHIIVNRLSFNFQNQHVLIITCYCVMSGGIGGGGCFVSICLWIYFAIWIAWKPEIWQT